MIALAQAAAGLTLVVGFALLCIRQIRAAAILLIIQSAAVSAGAIAEHQPLLALPSLLLAAAVWFAPGRVVMLPPRTLPIGGMKPALAAAATLTVLCQSQGVFALPLSVLLLGVLLAATREHRWMRVIALVQMQNGVALAGCLVGGANPILAVACCALPLPLGIGLALRQHYDQRPSQRPHLWPIVRTWVPHLDLAASLGVFAATVLVPLVPLSSAFAPLLGLDGVCRSYARRNRPAMPPSSRLLASLTTTMIVVAACTTRPIMMWLAVLIAIGAHLLPILNRRVDAAVLAFSSAGVMLFGLLLLAGQPMILGYFCLFAGIAGIVSVVPDLVLPLGILLLRLSIQGPWPPAASALGMATAVFAMVACAVRLRRGHSIASLQLVQASIAFVGLCLGTPDGRFAALIMITLLILARAASRLAGPESKALPTAALLGIPPFGVFPGLVLVTLAISGHVPWLLLPVGAGFLAVLLTTRFRTVSLAPSPAWLPLALTLAAGYFAPDGLVRWWHVLVAGQG